MKRKRIELGRDGPAGSVRNSVCMRGKKKNKKKEGKEYEFGHA
jgi:hypothetical protein